MEQKEFRPVLLHCCCAPCSSAIIEWMLANHVRPTLYYFNPNIYPIEEYQIRKDECTRYAQTLGLAIIDEDYDHNRWLTEIHGLENEPERGARCLQCFRIRLLKTARKAAELGIQEFTTTLASSRWKSLEQINAAGRWAAELVQNETGIELHFDDRNWRKGGLQQRRNELLKQNGFYNQLYCGCEFSLEAMRRRSLPEVPSTNTWVLDTLNRGVEMVDETVVYTLRQTAGRGQVGNVWESEPDKNIAFSMLLCPVFLPVRDQFLISELCSLGILEGLRQLAAEQNVPAEKLSLSIKWPNDIYAGDNKLGGILIENRLQGTKFANAVLGVGINVNQERWIGNAPNPVSLRMLGIDATPKMVLEYVVKEITRLYHTVRDSAVCGSQELARTTSSIHVQFKSSLYRSQGFYPYYDPNCDEHFDARIADVKNQGPIVLELRNGEERTYWFKDVRFVLPCGVTKE